LTSRLKVKRRDGLLLAIFYAVVGILQLATLAVIDIRMMWIGALAILSLIAAYGLFTARRWAVWLVIGLFFPQAVFAVFSLNGVISLYSLSAELIPLLMEVSLGAFLVLSLVSFIYVAAKRETFEA